MTDITFEFACRDDCLDQIVPSDLRQLASERDRLRQRVNSLEDDVEKWKGIASQINTDWIPANKKLSEELTALKQQGEPVAIIKRNSAGQIYMADPSGEHFDMSKHIGASLYTSAPTIPEGYVLVPVEPTQQILEGLEVGMSYDECNNFEFDACIAYQAMLIAAPKLEESK